MHRIYLDHTATTPLDPRVLEAMQPYFGDRFGNPSSAHWHGRQAKHALEEARAEIAAAIGAKPAELVFTSGGTESDNIAILGALKASRRRHRSHLITEAAEHHAVLDTCLRLRDEGVDVTVLGVDQHGSVSAESVEAALRSDTALVSVMHANNEVGTVQAIGDIARVARSRGVSVHTDAVQSIGKIPLRVDELGAHLLTITAHKINGPKGIGALWVSADADWEPVFFGGGQEKGKRPGTENVALAVGFAAAVRIAVGEREAAMRRAGHLRDMLQRQLQHLFPSLLVNGHPERRLPHLLSVSFDSGAMPMEGEMLVANLDLEGIAASSGSACTSGSIQPSHVLLAMGRDSATAKATVRFSFGRGNSDEDIAVVVGAMRRIVGRMSKGAPG